MNYPLISEYIEAIKSSEDNFEELTNLRPILSDDGQPVMTSGNFAVVFKMEDVETGKFYALKCFTKEQDGREEAYHLIADALKDVDSPYLVSLRYLDKELFVDTDQTNETEFPVLLMDWVEGKTLDKYLRENLDDKYALEMLAYRFSQLAQWLIPQPFAHGDLKPDNILVSEDGTLVLVDYDGMYVPAMKGQKARELGSPDFRHPLRTENDFDEHIDDFPLVSILLSLKAISLNPQLLDEYGASDRLLFSEEDYRDIANSSIMRCILGHLGNKEIAKVYSLFVVVLSEKIITQDSFRLVFTDKCQEELYKVYEKQSRFDKYSKYYLSSLLRYGIGCERDVKKGLELIVELAEQGFAEAQFRLGRCYYLGEGLPKDYEKAVKWYTRAAEQGFGKAQNNLGYLYYNGQGGTQNYEKAAEWISKAAEQGLANSQYLMAVLFLKGHGVAQSYENAAEWFTKAANQGYASAQYSLGLLYCNAQGVPHSYEKANDLLIKAAEQGQKQAIKRLEQVTSDDIANAWTDEYGVMYSSDRKRLLKAVDSFKVAQYIISDKVQIICNGAFRNCKGLEDIFIPNSVRFIGEEVYYGCENLTSITIPSSIINIGDWVLHNCRNLKRIIVDVGNANYDSRDNCNAIIETKSNTLIAGCQNTRIPNGVTNIGNGAFSFVSNLNNITIPSSLIHIPDEAFWGCNGLTSVIIQNGVKRIGKNAFSCCSDLTSIFIPESVTAIEKGAFTGNSDECAPFPNNLMQINVDSKNPKYNSKDNCNAIIETESNTLIVGCQNTIIPNGITSISAWAFDGCFKLSSIVIPGSIVSIPDRTFEFLGLTSVTLLNGIMSIGEMAFYGCNKLTSIIIPNSITSIGNRAFAGCDKFTSITIPRSVSNIGEEAFAGVDSIKSYQGYFDGRNNLECIIVDEENNNYDSRNHCNAIIETHSNTLIAGCQNTVIPHDVNTIGKRAFSYCEELTAIEIPDGVNEIRDYAFYGCRSLEKIVLPNSITKVGEYAFESDTYYLGNWGITNVPLICIPNGTKNKFEELLPKYKEYLVEDTIDTHVSDNDLKTGWTDEYGVMYSTFKNRLLKAHCTINEYTIRRETKAICDDAFHGKSVISITIPNGVINIGKCTFAHCGQLTSITIPESVKHIGTGVLSWCNSLEQIIVDSGNSTFDSRNNCNAIIETISNTLIAGCKHTKIPDSVIAIGDSAFKGCRNLYSITIPENVTSIGNSAFCDCNNLLDITIPSSVVCINDNAFQGCKQLTTITICYGVTNIGKGAFNGCKNLTSIVIPKSVRNIGEEAFYGCENLKDITIENGVEVIGKEAFRRCYKINSIAIPQSVVSIGLSAFSGCSGVTSIVVESDNKIFDSRDNCNAIIETASNRLILGCQNTVIPNSVTEIGHSAFIWCTLLTNITIPNGIKKIGYDAFRGCTNLTHIEIPSSVTEIDTIAFAGCSSLISVVFSNDMICIAHDAFTGCNFLRQILIPEGTRSKFEQLLPEYKEKLYEIENILRTNVTKEDVENSWTDEYGVMYSADGRRLLKIPNHHQHTRRLEYKIKPGTKLICDFSFTKAVLKSVAIPKSVICIGSNAFFDCFVSSFIVESGNTLYDSRDNCNAIIDSKSNTLLVAGFETNVIPDSVTHIGKEAFVHCTLASIEIPNKVVSIGDDAFRASDLWSIKIPSCVKKIGENVFASCGELNRIEVEMDNTNYDSRDNCNAIIETKTNTLIAGCNNTIIPNSVITIGNRAFSNRRNLKSIKIPNSVTKIGVGAFFGCGLTVIHIPDSIMSIGDSAFAANKLVSISIPTSVMSIGKEAFRECRDLEYVTILNGEMSIAANAFSGCESLKRIIIPKGSSGFYKSLLDQDTVDVLFVEK